LFSSFDFETLKPKKNWPEAFQSSPPLQTDYIEAPYKISFVLLNHLHIKRGLKRYKKDSFTDRKEREEIKEANASAIERNTEG